MRTSDILEDDEIRRVATIQSDGDNLIDPAFAALCSRLAAQRERREEEQRKKRLAEWEQRFRENAKRCRARLRKFLSPIMEGDGYWRVSSRDPDGTVIEERWYATPDALLDDLTWWQDISEKPEVQQVSLGLIGRKRAALDAPAVPTRVVALHDNFNPNLPKKEWWRWLWTPQFVIHAGATLTHIWLVDMPCTGERVKAAGERIGGAVEAGRTRPVLRIPLPQTFFVVDQSLRMATTFNGSYDRRYEIGILEQQTILTTPLLGPLNRAHDAMMATEGRGLSDCELLDAIKQARRAEVEARRAQAIAKHRLTDEELQ